MRFGNSRIHRSFRVLSPWNLLKVEFSRSSQMAWFFQHIIRYSDNLSKRLNHLKGVINLKNRKNCFYGWLTHLTPILNPSSDWNELKVCSSVHDMTFSKSVKNFPGGGFGSSRWACTVARVKNPSFILPKFSLSISLKFSNVKKTIPFKQINGCYFTWYTLLPRTTRTAEKILRCKLKVQRVSNWKIFGFEIAVYWITDLDSNTVFTKYQWERNKV